MYDYYCIKSLPAMLVSRAIVYWYKLSWKRNAIFVIIVYILAMKYILDMSPKGSYRLSGAEVPVIVIIVSSTSPFF